jgi:transcriptional regulator with XRE-family HTH domain
MAPSIDEEINTAGHSRRLRRVMLDARKRQKLTGKQVAERIDEIMLEQARARGEDTAPKPVHENTVYSWERFENHPAIDKMAAWARALGYRLVVTLDGAHLDREPVLLTTPEAAEAGRIVDGMDESARRALVEFLRNVMAR